LVSDVLNNPNELERNDASSSDMRPYGYYLEVKHKKGKREKGKKGKRDASFDTLLLPATLDVGKWQAQLLQRYCCSQTCMKLNQLKL
jgi:hypothetical protein